MHYFYLIIAVIVNAMVSLMGKGFTQKNAEKKDASQFFNFIQLSSIFLCWTVMFLVEWQFSWSVLPYSLLFALFFTACMVSMIYALKSGPVSLTTLIINLSLMVTTIWGFIFWDERITPLVVIGLVLVVGSVILCVYNKGEKSDKKLSAKWLIFVLIAFIGNAGCTIVQKTQQLAFDGEYGNMLMCFAMVFAFLTCLYFYLKSDKKESREMLKTSWWLPVTSGVCNVLLNVFVMLLAVSTISSSIVYPVISVGSLVVVMIASLFVFKEKLTKLQYLGIFVGAVATVLLSI